MSTSFVGTNMVATGIEDLEFNKDRRYLAIIATAPVTVTISGGTSFDLDAGEIWSPMPAPINDIAFTGDGTMIVG